MHVFEGGGHGGKGPLLFRGIPTRWSVLKGPPLDALNYLALTYGNAVLNYMRGRLARGDFHPLRTQDCDDLFQDLFVRLGSTEWLKKPDPARGPFRLYFIGRLSFFLRERRSAAIAKLHRTAGPSLDDVPDPTAEDPLDAHLEKEWKQATVKKTLDQIRKDHPTWSEVLDAYLAHSERDDAGIAKHLGRSIDSYRSVLKRARKAFRDLYPIVTARLDGFGGAEF